MDRTRFEEIVAQTFERLPERFKEVIENVGVVVEDYPTDEIVQKMHLRSRSDLLGLYQGIPLTKGGSWYGMVPVAPDKISLYQKNIESHCSSDDQVIDRIYEVLLHAIGHYFGIREEE